MRKGGGGGRAKRGQPGIQEKCGKDGQKNLAHLCLKGFTQCARKDFYDVTDKIQRDRNCTIQMAMHCVNALCFMRKIAVEEKPHLHAFVISIIIASGHIESHWVEAG